jgi:hypothetical protein
MMARYTWETEVRLATHGSGTVVEFAIYDRRRGLREPIAVCQDSHICEYIVDVLNSAVHAVEATTPSNHKILDRPDVVSLVPFKEQVA